MMSCHPRWQTDFCDNVGGDDGGSSSRNVYGYQPMQQQQQQQRLLQQLLLPSLPEPATVTRMDTDTSLPSSSSTAPLPQSLPACLPTEDLRQYLLLSTQEAIASLEVTANKAFQLIKNIARQCMSQTIVDYRRQQASTWPTTSLSLSTTTSPSKAQPHPDNRGGRRVRLVATERRFIAALYDQSQRELRQYCLETRDRTVAESFSSEHGVLQQTRSIGDARLEQIRADFYDGFEPHEGQIALFEMLLEQIASRIYAEEWERDWRAICDRNHWHNVRLRLGFSASIMPRRTGKTTVGARSALVFAMNIPRWKGVIIGTSVETASYTIDELDKQFYACSRAVRDFKYVHTAGAVAMAPWTDLQDVRTWITIPGEVRACARAARLVFSCLSFSFFLLLLGRGWGPLFSLFACACVRVRASLGQSRDQAETGLRHRFVGRLQCFDGNVRAACRAADES